MDAGTLVARAAARLAGDRGRPSEPALRTSRLLLPFDDPIAVRIRG